MKIKNFILGLFKKEDIYNFLLSSQKNIEDYYFDDYSSREIWSSAANKDLVDWINWRKNNLLLSSISGNEKIEYVKGAIIEWLLVLNLIKKKEENKPQPKQQENTKTENIEQEIRSAFNKKNE